MKKGLLIISLLTLLFIGAYAKAGRLVELTIVNKSGLPVEVSLTGIDHEETYYLRIPKGDRLVPMERTYAVIPDYYTAQLYYMELWDPVYGATCSSSSQTLHLLHKQKVFVLECNTRVPNGGDYPLVKYGGRIGR